MKYFGPKIALETNAGRTGGVRRSACADPIRKTGVPGFALIPTPEVSCTASDEEANRVLLESYKRSFGSCISLRMEEQ